MVQFAGSEKTQAAALSAVRNDPLVRVIIVPMRASEGAAGLTLTMCNLAYMFEPAIDLS